MTDTHDDSLKKALALHERMAEFAKESDFSRMARQIAASQPNFEVPLGVRNMIAEFRRHDELMKGIIGPGQELSALLKYSFDSDVSRQFREMQEAARSLQEQFRLPAVTETTRLWMDLQNQHSEIARRAMEYQSGIQEAMKAMRSPWLDIQDQVKSMSGFSALQAIGESLRISPAFSDTLAETFRSGLGDWRDQMTIGRIASR
jgi:hypothetical protein